MTYRRFYGRPVCNLFGRRGQNSGSINNCLFRNGDVSPSPYPKKKGQFLPKQNINKLNDLRITNGK